VADAGRCLTRSRADSTTVVGAWGWRERVAGKSEVTERESERGRRESERCRRERKREKKQVLAREREQEREK